MQILNYAVGYGFSCIVGHFMVRLIWVQLWRGMTKAAKDNFIAPYSLHPQMIGIIERFLYTTAWLVNAPEFVAIWMAMKIGGRWGAWEGTQETKHKDVDGTEKTITLHGRTIYNVFLIGAGLSLIYGVGGGLLVDWQENEQCVKAAGAIILLVLVSFYFWWWAKRDADKQAKGDHPTQDKAS